MPWTTSGTISVTNNSTTVNGSGTTWASAGLARAGDVMLIGGALFEVASVQSNTQLTLASNYLGANASGLSYALIHTGLLPAELAVQISDLQSKYLTTIAQLYEWETSANPTVDLTNPATNVTTAVTALQAFLTSLSAYATKTGAETLTSKTLISPTINGGTISNATLLSVNNGAAGVAGTFAGGDTPMVIYSGTGIAYISTEADVLNAIGIYAGGNGMRGIIGGNERWFAGNAVFRGGADNFQTLGDALHRWSVVYAGTGTINTSDGTQKHVRSELAEPELLAWGRVRWLVFQFLDAIERKGVDARLHAGTIAQEVQAAFAAEGLDAARYGLWCQDEIFEDVEEIVGTETVDEPVMETVDVPDERIEIRSGVPTLVRGTKPVTRQATQVRAVVDEAGDAVMVDRTGADGMPVVEPLMVDVPITTPVVRDKTERRQVSRGMRLGLRYDQCLVFEAAYLRSRLAAAEARITALEQGA
ncbi:MAG: hypothetical protein H6R10_691 [Rhodocyclaceae bacterium]|nr:hypothetical protein [Rhodocyclaceae bacterium]